MNENTPQVVDLGTFINILTDWHKTKLQFLEHLKNVPEGVAISINDGEDIAMTGQLLEGFRLGLGLALSELGTFPISKGILTEIPDPLPSEGESNGTVH